MTITVSVNCQISYRLLKFKGLKSTFLLTFIIYIYLYSHTAKYNGTEKNNNIIIT